ncbi:serine/threonine protein kinase [Candidatus Bathyarchaeota archaeon]|nr:serine/threonine protein kinase [Candidatus Bathyarchaeota archaeon]
MSKTLCLATLKELFLQPYIQILCYPKPTIEEAEKRVKELQSLNISKIEFSGEKEVYGLKVLGKGCVGIVVKTYFNGNKAALKIRRVDADRADLTHEAFMLKKVNMHNIGPKLYGFTKNFILMEFINGQSIIEWVKKLQDNYGKKLKKVLMKILEECFKLDNLGLDHGELSRAHKHILINEYDTPIIVDFETASNKRKPSNLTKICHFLFFQSEIAFKINKILNISLEDLREALKAYKINKTQENFELLLNSCGLKP